MIMISHHFNIIFITLVSILSCHPHQSQSLSFMAIWSCLLVLPWMCDFEFLSISLSLSLFASIVLYSYFHDFSPSSPLSLPLASHFFSLFSLLNINFFPTPLSPYFSSAALPLLLVIFFFFITHHLLFLFTSICTALQKREKKEKKLLGNLSFALPPAPFALTTPPPPTLPLSLRCVILKSRIPVAKQKVEKLH